MIQINYLAVLVAGFINMALGFMWYGPLFGKQWIALMKITPEQMEEAKKKGMAKTMAAGFVVSLVMAYVLAHFAAVWGIMDVAGAFAIAFWLWLGFIATTMIDSVLWENKPASLYFLNISYRLVALFAMALVFAFWR